MRQKIGKFDRQSPQFVVAHGLERLRRGRRPSMSFKGIKDPRAAFQWAQIELVGKPRDSMSLAEGDLVDAVNAAGKPGHTELKLSQVQPGATMHIQCGGKPEVRIVTIDAATDGFEFDHEPNEGPSSRLFEATVNGRFYTEGDEDWPADRIFGSVLPDGTVFYVDADPEDVLAGFYAELDRMFRFDQWLRF